MRFLGIAATVLLAAFESAGILRAGTGRTPLPILGPPQPAEPGRVRFLIRQLDDRRFAVRREADRVLRKMPTAIVPLLQAKLKTRPSLEVTRRLESIIQDLSRIPWQTDLAAATAEARRTHKPLFVFSADRQIGDPSMPISATFADRELVGYVREHLIPVWHVQTPGRIPRIVSLAFLGNNPAKIQMGMWPAENARSYFCTPEGRVVHYVEGHLDVDTFRNEVRHSRQIARRMAALPEEEGFATARSSLMIRDGDAAQRQHSFRPHDEEPGIATPVPDLIGQPVAPILDRLRSVMVQLMNGC